MNRRLPSELGNLSSLKLLVLVLAGVSTDEISIPSEIANLSNMERLQLAGANFLDPYWLENAFSAMTNLRTISILNSQFNSSGTMVPIIPTEIGLITTLKIIEVGVTDLKGTLPTELGQLTELQRLVILKSDITGTIPTELGLLTKLTRLSMVENSLTGTLPSELDALTRLIDYVPPRE